MLQQYKSPGFPSPAAALGAVAADVTALVALQTDGGGFAHWDRTRGAEPYVSIQVTHALVAAKNAGFAVPPATLANALNYIANVEAHFLAQYSEPIRDTLSGYALHVRALAGSRDTVKAQALWVRRGTALALEGAAWLWPIIDDPASDAAIERSIQNSAVETADAVTFRTSYGDDAYVVLSSQRRVDGVVLDALIAKRPQSTLIPKVVTGLLSHRTAGHWDSVQENSFILLALKRYFDTYESQTPNFLARVWLGERFAGEQSFVGRSTDRLNFNVPTVGVIAAGNTSIVLAKEGTGRLYYRLGLRYSPSNLRSDPLDRGFVVARTYQAVDDPSEVSRDSEGVWHVKAGARVRVKLTMIAESQRTHVALVDSLPAGFEILNPGLVTSPAAPKDGSAAIRPWWQGSWYDHQNLRDDRAEAFSTIIGAGTYDYSYIAKATTPGSFVVPPARAEQIYSPESFGRSGSASVVVA